MKKNKYLGIDFGSKNVGIAVSDSSNVVFMRGVVKGGGKLTDIFEKIYRLCVEEKINTVVFGVPYGPQREESAQAQRMKRLGRSLIEYLKNRDLEIDLVFEDESFSTFEAEKLSGLVSDMHFDARHSDHEIAAKVILEKYLDRI